jgi:hypothetical protein
MQCVIILLVHIKTIILLLLLLLLLLLIPFSKRFLFCSAEYTIIKIFHKKWKNFPFQNSASSLELAEKYSDFKYSSESQCQWDEIVLLIMNTYEFAYINSALFGDTSGFKIHI